MNKAIFSGRLTRDPEIRYTSNQKAYALFGIAVNRRYVAGKEQKVDFFNVVTWNKTAEFCSKNFSKGQQILIIGRMQNRSYENEEGKKVNVTELIGEEVDFAGYNNNGNASNASNTSNITDEDYIDFDELAKEMEI